MTATQKREIAFIDRGVDDLATLLAGIRPDIEPILLSNDEPAPRQMARAVQGREGQLDVIHVIAHGRPGDVNFSSATVSLQTLGDHAGDIHAIRRAIVEDGKLLLWSCETGQGNRGADFINALSLKVGAFVAASTELVGSPCLGGSWTSTTQ